MNTAVLSVAVKTLEKAEKKLSKIQAGADAAVTKAIAKATDKAKARYAAKVADATKAVEAAKVEVNTAATAA